MSMSSESSEATAAAPARVGAGPETSADATPDPGTSRGRRASDRSGTGGPYVPSRGVPLWLLAVVVGLLLVLTAWFVQDRTGRVERDLARRLQDAELRDGQRDQQLKLLGDTLRETQAKAAVLEAKLADSLGQQSQLRQLYDEMARTRGDLMLADVENSIMIAAQQLQLGGNVQSALLALTDAEQVLARSNQSALIGLRRVITRDIERLKAVPLADFAAAVNRLDAVVAMIEQMPLLADVQPNGASTAGTRPGPPGDPQPGLRGLPERVARTGQQGWDAFVAELRALVRVQRVDQPEALLLAPDQRFLARESLRLQLLNARLNLLARNEQLFRADLGRATAAIDKWFDGQHKSVVAAQGALRQLQGTRLAVDLPSLAESVAAVRAARAASDAR
jgi:uroporphyrin-3 C-methyltransferase/uroporphyrinogen III methyltransferase/synthase